MRKAEPRLEGEIPVQPELDYGHPENLGLYREDRADARSSEPSPFSHPIFLFSHTRAGISREMSTFPLFLQEGRETDDGSDADDRRLLLLRRSPDREQLHRFLPAGSWKSVCIVPVAGYFLHGDLV